MNWWNILKQTWNPQDPYGVKSQTTTRKLPVKTPQYDPQRVLNMPSTSPIQPDTAVGNQQVQAGQGGQKGVTQSYPKPPQLQTQTTQYTGTSEAGGDDSSSDDTDVGTIRQNVDAAKRNLSQLPRGPKAAELTEILNLISQASIDPVKQKDIAVEAKKKLHTIFPSSMA